jgi:hypothetical protein
MKNRLSIYAMCLLIGLISGCGDGSGDGFGRDASGDGPLIGSYSFDETTGAIAINSANVKYQGIINGASRVSGKVGNALQFGAPSSSVNINPGYGDGKQMTFSNDTISIGAWIKADIMAPGTYSHIAGNGDGGGQAFRLQLNVDKLELLLSGSGDNYSNYVTIITSAQQLLPSTWYHVMVTYDGTIAKLYINGVLDKSVTISCHFDTVWNTIYLGARGESGGYINQFHGTIDELKLYNSILPSTTIQAYYDSTK